MFAHLKTVDTIHSLFTLWERSPEAHDLQALLLELNTTINHDLVFDLANALSPECDVLTPEGRQRDHQAFMALIHDITQTIIAAQARLLTRSGEPALATWMLEDLLEGWGETVWKHAEALLRSRSEIETEAIRFQIDRRTAKRADAIRHAHLLHVA